MSARPRVGRSTSAACAAFIASRRRRTGHPVTSLTYFVACLGALSSPIDMTQLNPRLWNLFSLTDRSLRIICKSSKDSTQRYAVGKWDVPDTIAKLLRALVELGRTDV